MIDRVETFTDLPDLRPWDRTGGRSELVLMRIYGLSTWPTRGKY